ncbi:hypothetical protein CYLTODRAFT_407425 [Cylindrobasidium torrendii FP15055 ss-10]|uniref:Uncharacterized protein n=1 Tax=Cylindrobasidium torrendii FP15055 ss-10 TaxID=1314674 RepID=A0A0D7BQ95_9AGAR|nr:hypothetical protein CYLTODRAFT_407425 [Cylindrobasidium torrendii FP15055 ss-10]
MAALFSILRWPVDALAHFIAKHDKWKFTEVPAHRRRTVDVREESRLQRLDVLRTTSSKAIPVVDATPLPQNTVRYKPQPDVMRPGQDLLWALPDPYSHFRLSGTVDVTPLGNSKMVVQRQRRRTRFFAVSDFFEPVERGKVYPLDGCLRHEGINKRVQKKLVSEETTTRSVPASYIPSPEDVSAVQKASTTAPRGMGPIPLTQRHHVSLSRNRHSRRSCSQKQSNPRLQEQPEQDLGLAFGGVITAVESMSSAEILRADVLDSNDVAPMTSLDEKMEQEQEEMEIVTELHSQLEKELDEELAEAAMDSETDVEEGDEGERIYSDAGEMFDSASKLELEHNQVPTTSTRTRDRRRMSWASDATLVESDEECGFGAGPFVEMVGGPDNPGKACLPICSSSDYVSTPNVDSICTTRTY